MKSYQNTHLCIVIDIERGSAVITEEMVGEQFDPGVISVKHHSLGLLDGLMDNIVQHEFLSAEIEHNVDKTWHSSCHNCLKQICVSTCPN